MKNCKAYPKIKTKPFPIVGSARHSISNILCMAGFAIILLACANDKDNEFDATGAFEAEEIIISAEAAGTIKEFIIEEGQTLPAGKIIGYVDSTQLYLKKRQLEAQGQAILSKRPDQSAQLASLKEQLSTAENERARIINLIKSEAATTKQLDDINGTINIVKKQIDAQRSSLQISTNGINKDAAVLDTQIAQLKDQLQKCVITNPINGTVLTKYAEANETTAPGKPLYKIADLTTIILRVYVTGDQFSAIKLNQPVMVHSDDGKGGYKETKGTITWISDKAEFTPKTIQTKAERANLVYAIKVRVVNDGTYKIGMYGEINFM